MAEKDQEDVQINACIPKSLADALRVYVAERKTVVPTCTQAGVIAIAITRELRRVGALGGAK